VLILERLFEEEAPIVEKVGKKRGCEVFDIYTTSVDGQELIALSLPLLRQKLIEKCDCYAFLDCAKVAYPLVMRGEWRLIKDSNGHNWLIAVKNGAVYDRKGQPIQVQNGKIVNNATMA
jgi:hypothetical protein